MTLDAYLRQGMTHPTPLGQRLHQRFEALKARSQFADLLPSSKLRLVITHKIANLDRRLERRRKCLPQLSRIRSNF